MEVNFNALNVGGAASSLTEPRRIFAALPNRAERYAYLRDVQTDVLDSWYERRREPDLVVKMNTGGGKTVVGLLMLQSSLNEGVGPAVYVAAEPYLAEQVKAEAHDLGIEVLDDPRDGRALSGQAISIITVKRLINGRSIFGVGQAGSKVPIGTVLVDDAHACLREAVQQCTLIVPRTDPAYQAMFDLFVDELTRQCQSARLDLESEDPSAAFPVPYWAWADSQERLMEVLHRLQDEDELGFHWLLVKDVLRTCTAVFTWQGVEIAPPCTPIHMIRSFGEAERRIYLTATLADDSVLVSVFDADPTSIATPVRPVNLFDIGERMILAPQEVNPHLTDNELKDLLRGFAKNYNVVVIVPSWRRADAWRDVAAVVAGADQLAAAVDSLSNGHVGLVVLVNRYDGVDLPGNACRILVIDGVPEAYGGLDRMEAACLAESEAMVARQIQRTEQGMGRAIRSNDDYCVVLLVGARLIQRIHLPTARRRFSPATRVQLELSDRLHAQLRGGSMDALRNVIRQSLERNPDWVGASRQALASADYAMESSIAAHVVHERKAFHLATVDDYRGAAQELHAAVRACGEPRLRGWLRQERAAYLHMVDRVGAQEEQGRALGDNRNLLRPAARSAYERIGRATASQAERCRQTLSTDYGGPMDFQIDLHGTLSDLDWDPERTEAFETAMEKVGLLLGFEAQRPEKMSGRGPDVLWALGDLVFAVIECKSGAKSNVIYKKDAAQMSSAIDWFVEHYDDSCLSLPVMVHPSHLLDKRASARAGMRVMNETKLDAFKGRVTAFGKSISTEAVWPSAEEIAKRLAAHELVGRSVVEVFTVPVRKAA